MNCPYCAEPVSSQATVCKTCRRDIALVTQLKIANLELEEKVHELQEELSRLRPGGPAEAVPAAEVPPPPPPGLVDLVVVYILVPILLLMGTHYLLVIKVDANLIWLRAVSIVLPALFGALLQRRLRARWYTALGFGVVVGLLAVLGMSTTVHFTDGDPILPRGTVDWRETLEYSTSIALGYLLGALLVIATQPLTAGMRNNGQIAKYVRMAVRMASNRRDTPNTLEEKVQRLVKLVRLGISVATAAGAIYTGFKNIL
jgi:hypothetical protein